MAILKLTIDVKF